MSQLITYTVEHYRKEGVTPEAFEKFFQEVHLATTLPMMKKYGFVKYSVQRRDTELCATFEPMLQAVHPTWNVSKADVVIQYWMPSLDSLMQLIQDPDWEGKAVKGQEDWIDTTRGTVHMTHETTYIENGEIVDL